MKYPLRAYSRTQLNKANTWLCKKSNYTFRRVFNGINNVVGFIFVIEINNKVIWYVVNMNNVIKNIKRSL